jgi:prepilin-type N-terminal cleavage/methylation domain-containing protein
MTVTLKNSLQKDKNRLSLFSLSELAGAMGGRFIHSFFNGACEKSKSTIRWNKYPSYPGREVKTLQKSFRSQSGFTLIELLVVIVIIGILAAIALPNFIKARNKAREAEVKSNIHSIQIALERYAVDNKGVYPTFLCGGERDSNILWCMRDKELNGTFQNSFFPSLTYSPIQVQGLTPFAVVTPRDINGNPNGDLGGGLDMLDADPLLFFGYLAQYPKNPFSRRDAGMWNSGFIGKTQMTGQFPYGGHHGDIMFDLGFGWGDAPQTDFVLYMTEGLEEMDQDYVSDPDLDAPGNFFYHPMFADGIPVYYHAQQAILGINQQAARGIASEDVLGFFLYGYGAPGDRDSLVEGGQDLFNRFLAGATKGNYGLFPPELTQFLSPPLIHNANASNQDLAQATGYNSTEYDPYTAAFPDGIDPMHPDILTLKSGSDGIQDWVIICVSAGSDNAPDIIRDALRYGEQN